MRQPDFLSSLMYGLRNLLKLACPTLGVVRPRHCCFQAGW